MNRLLIRILGMAAVAGFLAAATAPVLAQSPTESGPAAERPCAPNTTVAGAMSTGQFVATLY